MSFELSTNPISPCCMSNPAAGALATFDGRVRDHNQGRQVLALEYEAFAPMAQAEFAKIESEAYEKWPILSVRCIHRVGRLEIGEVAVWAGVLAAHRRDAFEACAYLIDQLKLRVPIWKKEFYADGSIEWVDQCGGCVAAHR